MAAKKTFAQAKQVFRDVAANEEVVTVLTFVPRRAGSTMLLVRSHTNMVLRVNIAELQICQTPQSSY